MYVGTFYLLFWKTSFSSVCVFRAFCFELNVLNQYFNQATLHNELKLPCSTYVLLKARIHCEIYLSDYFVKHNLMHMLLYLIWFHEIRMKYVKRKSPRTIIRKKTSHISMFATSSCSGHWLTCFSWKGYFHRRLFFSKIILPGIKSGSFTIEFRCSCAINKFGTGTLCRIFKYSSEHLKVPGNL